MVENTVGKRRNWIVTSNFSFFPVFSKDLYCRHVKSRACLGKGYHTKFQYNTSNFSSSLWREITKMLYDDGSIDRHTDRKTCGFQHTLWKHLFCSVLKSRKVAISVNLTIMTCLETSLSLNQSCTYNSEKGCFWKHFQLYGRELAINTVITVDKIMLTFNNSGKKSFWKHFGKWRKCFQHLFLFPLVFTALKH